MLLDQLSALSHPQRMSVFRLLVRRCPDALPAGEIARTLAFKPSTTSVYLSALVQAGLIRQTRVGTSLRYDFLPEAAETMISGLFLDCCRGRPDLCVPEFLRQKGAAWRVLFVCTGNSARSIFAEALLRQLGGAQFVVQSAGTAPYEAPNPYAIDVLKSHDIRTDGLRPKALDAVYESAQPDFDFVFTVCDRAANAETVPMSPHTLTAHWGAPDPVVSAGTAAQKRAAFEACFQAMRARIDAFAAVPFATLTRGGVQDEIDKIGRMESLT